MSGIGEFIKQLFHHETPREQMQRLRQEERARMETIHQERIRQIEELEKKRREEQNRQNEENAKKQKSTAQKKRQKVKVKANTIKRLHNPNLVVIKDGILGGEYGNLCVTSEKAYESLKNSPESDQTRKEIKTVLKLMINALHKHRNWNAAQGETFNTGLNRLKRDKCIAEDQIAFFREVLSYVEKASPYNIAISSQQLKKLLDNYCAMVELACSETRNMMSKTPSLRHRWTYESPLVPKPSKTINTQRANTQKPKTEQNVNLSFKKYETQGSKSKDNKERYVQMYSHLETAKARMNEGEYKSSLYESARLAFEDAVDELLKSASVEISKTDTLEDKVNMLVRFDVISKEQSAIFHKMRKFGNLGAHNQGNPTLSDAQNAINGMNTVIHILIQNTPNESSANKPLLDPVEYYNASRKYYGRWANCYNYQNLAMNSAYLDLKRKADDGDIEAMLDIANGFLGKDLWWDTASMVCNKNYNKCLDAYDARYYYWILRACSTAYENWTKGKYLPLRYIATALLEAMKFLLYRECIDNFASQTDKNKPNQYAHIEKNMFGPITGNIENFADMLLAMMNEYNSNRLIAPVHKENSIKYVKYLMHLKYAYGVYSGPRYTSYYTSHIITSELIRLENESKKRFIRKHRSSSLPAKYVIEKEDKNISLFDAIDKYRDFVTNVHLERIGHISRLSQN